MKTLHIPCDPGEISDGYHTFNELYDHRCTLFLALMASNPALSWISAKHHDGSDLLCFVELPENLSNKYFPPTHDLPKTAQISKSQKSNVVNYSPMKHNTPQCTACSKPSNIRVTDVWRRDRGMLRCIIAEDEKLCPACAKAKGYRSLPTIHSGRLA